MTTRPPDLDRSVSETARLERFVRAHQRAVWRYLRAWGCQPSTADDLTQEVLVRGIERAVPALPADAARRYLTRAAKNALHRAVRDRRVRAEVSPAETPEPFGGDGPAGALDTDDRVAALRECLSVVDDRARDVLDRRYRDACSSTEIGRALGIREAHVNTIIHRAKAALRRCIEGKVAR